MKCDREKPPGLHTPEIDPHGTLERGFGIQDISLNLLAYQDHSPSARWHLVASNAQSGWPDQAQKCLLTREVSTPNAESKRRA